MGGVVLRPVHLYKARLSAETNCFVPWLIVRAASLQLYLAMVEISSFCVCKSIDFTATAV